ncbi:helix-turn-helix domain-containing protein [Clostridium felsineum]|uniref:helix-turn-helix domain-containing protein n=1 Tax=Clostridium felsineum TaxID=36839 RepID=UPI00214DB441|nr:helix-turn-helix transcriptional regulator [Clostridium felsineum]MCR3760031.1 helix-turn-helix domain-containing protein [Clostridium felsineum]
MDTYEIMSIGDKLKNLRKKYNLSQDDLAGNQITRNLISQIEHNKANLTKSSAKIMLTNLKKICDKKNTEVEEDIDYLLEDERSQANKVLDRYIRELKDLTVYRDGAFLSKLSEIEEFLAKWDIKDKKITIFEMAGDYYSNIRDFYNSSMYYEKAKAIMDGDIHNEDMLSVLRKLSMIYYYMGKYEEDIKCCDFAINHFKDMSEEYYCIFIYNKSSCYMNLKQHDVALEGLKEIEYLTKKISMDKYYDVCIQIATCLAELGEYDESLIVYNKILDYVGEKKYEKHIMVFINVVEIYMILGNDEKIKENLNLIFETKKHLNENFVYLPETYFQIGKIGKNLKDLKLAEEYYEQALTYAKKNMRYYVEADILCELVDLYIEKNSKEKILDVMNEFFILTGKEGKISTKVMYKLIDFYLSIKDINSLKDILSFSKKFI